MPLSKDQILSAQDLKTISVPVPEWGGSVSVRTLSGVERDEWEASIVGENRKLDTANLRARFAALVIVDDSGQRMFNDLDAQLLGRKSARALNRVFEAGQKLNGIRDEDVEELAKNSGSAPSGASTSSSPTLAA